MIRMWKHGILLDKRKSKPLSSVGLGATGEKRGKIEAFSSSARYRLRYFLLSMVVPGKRRVGVTLTLPWVRPSSGWEDVMDDFKAVMHRFRVYWLRAFPSCACVFRVELQKRGAPHVHLVAWHDDTVDLETVYFTIWYKSVMDLRGGTLSGFYSHGVKVDRLPNITAVIRYLCDHTGKRKQAQLGYKGKQWGVLGRSNMVQSVSVPLNLPESCYPVLFRFLRKIVRFRVKSKCVFGSRLSSSHRLNRIVYVSRETVFRFCRWHGWL